MQAVLVMFRSDGERRSFSIARDMTVVGRREDCDLRIPLGEVSRKHCRLVRDGESLRLEDLGSSNGTFLNGQRVQEYVLQPGDSIQVGPVVFVLQIDGYPADEDLSPVSAPLSDAGRRDGGFGASVAGTTQSEVADLVEGLDQPPAQEEAELSLGQISTSDDLVDLEPVEDNRPSPPVGPPPVPPEPPRMPANKNAPLEMEPGAKPPAPPAMPGNPDDGDFIIADEDLELSTDDNVDIDIGFNPQPHQQP